MAASEGEHQLTIPDGTRAVRADKILAAMEPALSRSRWQKLFHEGRVWLDDRVLRPKDKLRAGDTVQFAVPAPKPLELRPVPMNLAVLYEDEDLLVVDKEPGRVVHPGAGTGEDTLVHGLLHHCRGSLRGIGGTERPGIVHRLDKETSGALVVAKSQAAFESLSAQFAERKVLKAYVALVSGVPDPPKGSVNEPIGRHSIHRTRMSCRADGRSARTDFVVKDDYKVASLLGLRIHTGRTHQIRVHMKHIGHPLLGDTLYGYRPGRLSGIGGEEALPVPRVMLHAARLEFRHPASGDMLRLEAPLPADFREVIAGLSRRFAPDESR